MSYQNNTTYRRNGRNVAVIRGNPVRGATREAMTSPDRDRKTTPRPEYTLAFLAPTAAGVGCTGLLGNTWLAVSMEALVVAI